MVASRRRPAPLVSVVVPTFDRADLVERCLEALAEQTYAPLEVVVVDDCSSDDTPRVLAEFAAAHPDMNLRSLRNERQQGANPSRNRGIEASGGDLIAFEDDDCIAEPDWIEHLVDGFVNDRVGAVTGLVEDPTPRNIYDLAFRGTHRVYGKVHATRLVACNMCVRRDLLEGALDEDRAEVSADNTVSGRGDEEGLVIKLRREGWEMRVAPRARVLHLHYYTRRSFFRQAWRGGRSAARVGLKYRLRLRPEFVCLALGYVWSFAALRWPWAWLPSLVCFSLFVGATLVYNEIWRKGKTPGQALRIAPIMTLYYHVRAFGYFGEYARALLGGAKP
jgi:glycosyltransferase involved in cell wall biosynthesis